MGPIEASHKIAFPCKHRPWCTFREFPGHVKGELDVKAAKLPADGRIPAFFIDIHPVCARFFSTCQ